MKCPFIYSNGKQCQGYISRVKIIKADIELTLSDTSHINELSIYPRYHFHLYCSIKGNHAGFKRHDSEQMKVWKLPSEIWSQLDNIGRHNSNIEKSVSK